MAEKVLFIAEEIHPYVAESTKSTIGRNLPQSVQAAGKEIRIFMPKWGNINERRNQLHEVIRLSGINLIIDDTDHPLIIKVASLQASRIQVYFIDNEDFFYNRPGFKDQDGTPYEDNDERMIFFNRGVLETVNKLRWCPDVVHCHGAFTSLVPLLIRKSFSQTPSFMQSKVVTSLYGSNFQQPTHERFLEKVLTKGIIKEDIEGLEGNFSAEDLLKFAIKHSDGIIEQTEGVNPELLEYARSLGKPVMTLDEHASEQAQTYTDFYDRVCQE